MRSPRDARYLHISVCVPAQFRAEMGLFSVCAWVVLESG